MNSAKHMAASVHQRRFSSETCSTPPNVTAAALVLPGLARRPDEHRRGADVVVGDAEPSSGPRGRRSSAAGGLAGITGEARCCRRGCRRARRSRRSRSAAGRTGWRRSARSGRRRRCAGETRMPSSWIAAVSVTGRAGAGVVLALLAAAAAAATASDGEVRADARRTCANGTARRERKRRCTVRPGRMLCGPCSTCPSPPPSSSPLDTETNGLGGERCELTEVGAVLVGGGELHEEWDSLVGVAHAAGARHPALHRDLAGDGRRGARARGRAAAAGARCCAGACWSPTTRRFDVRVLRQAFARAALEWPDPPVICTVAARAPVRAAAAPPRAGDAGRRAGDRGRRGPPRAAGRAHVRAGVLRAVRAPVRERADDRRRDRAARRAQGPHAAAEGARGRAASARTSPALPHEPGVYIFRDADGRPLYVGKSVDLRTRARSHFTTGATWAAEAEHVDHQVTESELGALLLEDRLIKALRPPGNVRGKAEPDGYVYLRCRLDIPFPILEVAREPAAGHAVCVGPVRGRAAAAELVEQLNSLFGLRHCGRTLPRREHPSAYGQMGRCLSPCLQRPGPEPLPRAPGRGAAAVRRPRRRRGAARARRRADRRGVARRSATSARRGCSAGATGWSRCSAGSAACCARSTPARGWCSRRTPRRRGASTRSGSPAAAWWTGAPVDGVAARAALGAGVRARTGGGAARRVAAGRGDPEARLVGAWIAAN